VEICSLVVGYYITFLKVIHRQRRFCLMLYRVGAAHAHHDLRGHSSHLLLPPFLASLFSSVLVFLPPAYTLIFVLFAVPVSTFQNLKVSSFLLSVCCLLFIFVRFASVLCLPFKFSPDLQFQLVFAPIEGLVSSPRYPMYRVVKLSYYKSRIVYEGVK